MKITKKNILQEAENGNLEVLNHPSADQVKDNSGWTPLHHLAWIGIIEVLNHPSVDKVKDQDGETPLHFLARERKVEILNHPSVDKVKDDDGWTPLHLLAWERKVKLKHLKEKYPWFKGLKKDQRINEELITEILNTHQSIRFILED